MLGEGEKDRPSVPNRKTYSRSVSWTGRSPSQSSSKPQWNSKARACLPPLQPLSIARPSIEEWPKPGSDDLGIWNSPPTPGVRPGSITPRENSYSGQTPREFEFKRDKLAYFNKECSRIVDYIYLGSDTIAQDREVLRQNGITHVLNCVGFLCPEYFKNDLVYKTLWLQDSPSEDITSILYDVFDYFEDVREQGGRVFVHCCQGVSRSTSLVIAYLMWKQGQSFEDAFQHVKAARGVTNPNMGFACQLLQCQKRVHALPASPSSVLRMYRMAPHSPYDPLHLVPKLLSEPGAEGLDSRGSFIVHVPSALYVWIGKHCGSVMSDTARAAAHQVIRYERAKGPVLIIRENEEPSEFWAALGKNGKAETVEGSSAGSSIVAASICPHGGVGTVQDYDLDFEIFHKALAGGVVPPFPLSGNESETCLPARENGWSKLRKKLASGIMKEFITSSKLYCGAIQTKQGDGNVETSEKFEQVLSPTDPLSSSSHQCDSPETFDSYATSSPSWTKSSCTEVKHSTPVTDPSLFRTLSFSSLDSFPGPHVSRSKSNTTSPSLSPSTSDYSSSFTFSPSSSNWSDLSYLSAQPSPSGMQSKDLISAKNVLLVEGAPLLCEGNSSPEDFSAPHAFRMSNTCSPCTGRSLSLAERRGNNPPPRMMLPSVDETSQVPVKSVRSCSFSLPDLEDEMITEVDCGELSRKSSLEMNREETMVDADIFMTDTEIQTGVEDKRFETCHLPQNDGQDTACGVTNLVLYQWPSMCKVEMHYGVLDSRSVYIMFVPDANFGIKDVLYIWIGREAAQKGGKSRNSSTFQDSYIQWETVGRDFIIQKGLSTNSLIQIVKEGEEPEVLLKHLPHFSFQNTLDSGIK
ncbi:hypothetical protein ACH5RR_035559 [Cinchona calisaya]|uniref:Protein-tyrosine-phosphatase MKP1 n=1 Tax=Cinchona calisaya TaxID=153742 RepID=A0ABD2Y2W3_9GENT